MKDAYSFDIDEAGLDARDAKHEALYRRIFTGWTGVVGVEADSGSMGGSASQEFMVFTDAGEDFIARCSYCNYAANVEKAVSKLPLLADLKPIRLTADYGDYLPTERAVHGGGYSAEVQSNQVGPEGGQMLVDRTIDAIKSMWTK